MREKYMSEKTKGQRHLQMVIWEKPPKTIPYYWIKVMESNGVAYHDHFDLYVYPKTFTIKYYDIANDIAMSLSQCRKQFINEKGSAIYL